jgi:hypothetical protein
MKYLLILLFLCASFSSPASVRYSVEHAVSLDFQRFEMPVKPLVKTKRKKRPENNANERYLMLAAIYMSAAVAVIFISLIFQPVFIFAIIFLPIFLWSMSGVAAFMSMIIMFTKMHLNSAEENESLAANVLTFLLSRILLLFLLFFLVEPIIAILFTVLLIPGFIVQLVTIIRLLRIHKSKSAEKDMFVPRS